MVQNLSLRCFKAGNVYLTAQPRSSRCKAIKVQALSKPWDAFQPQAETYNQVSGDEIDGGNFVIKRSYKIHGPDFVIKRPTHPIPQAPPRGPRRHASMQIIPYGSKAPFLRQNLASMLALPGDITQCSVLMNPTEVQYVPDDAVEVLPDDFVLEASAPADVVDAAPPVAPSPSTGIVWVQSGQPAEGPRAYQPDDSQDAKEFTGSPRRTSRLQFTCNICQTRNEKLVNPRAMKEGTVFARCDGCKIVHKLCDNLNLIDEIVYSRDMPDTEADSAAEQQAVESGLPRMPIVVSDLCVPPGLVVEPQDPISN